MRFLGAGVAEAAELMSKARTDAGLVESADGSLVGILTDSDVSIKIAASGLSLRKTTVEEAMTPNPLCVREHERADKALALMAEKRARHLPLLDAQGGLSGMLDIAKVLYDAITRLEKTKDASENMYFPAMNRMVGVGETTSVPTLADALRGRPPPATAAPADAIEVAFAGLRRTRRSVLVLDEAGKLVGILSKSDVAKRALRTALSVDTKDDSAELKALNRLRVRDVMTPRPDYIASTRTVLDALHKMHDGKYSNMPIIDPATDEPVGVVDVLDLLRAAMSGSPLGPTKMPSLLEGFFAAPKSDDVDDQPRLSKSKRGSRAATFAETAEPTPAVAAQEVPIATAVELATTEQLPHRNTVSCAILPSTLKHAKGNAPAVVPNYGFELTLPNNQRLRVPGDSNYASLVSAVLGQLDQYGALEVQFDYFDPLSRLRVVNDDSLRAATQLRLSLDPGAANVPLSVVVVKRKITIKLFANVVAVAALAAALAFVIARAPQRS